MAERVRDIVSKYDDVAEKMMFGCKAFLASDAVFVVIWKAGRIGVKLPDTKLRVQARDLPGADPWTAGKKQMREWVLLPVSFHSDERKLKRWIDVAHQLAAAKAQ